MKDATVEFIESVKAHPNADKLELAKILGYQCVVPKGVYFGGETVVYIRTDSVLPKDKAWAEKYLKYAEKRVKSIKLRGEFSEGFVIPIEEVSSLIPKEYQNYGADVSDELGVTHYEPPVPKDLSAKGALPFYICKTDEERIENLKDDEIPWGDYVDVTRKRDGSSNSFYYELETDTFGILSRSMELKEDSINQFTVQVEKYNIKEVLRAFCLENQTSLCIRGEVFGQGIQKFKSNPDKDLPLQWEMFSVWDIKERRYYRKGELFYFDDLSKELGLPAVPILEKNIVLTKELYKHYSESDIGFEGAVINHPEKTFKIINKIYDGSKL